MIYADSSVIVKRYYREPGSNQVRESWHHGDRVFTSRIAYAEVHAALAHKRRDGGISTVQLRRLANAFDAEWPAYDHILVDRETSVHVRRLVFKQALRGLDAIHLSAALWLQEEIREEVEFWAADEKLLTAARREGLSTVNPEI